MCVCGRYKGVRVQFNSLQHFEMYCSAVPDISLCVNECTEELVGLLVRRCPDFFRTYKSEDVAGF